MILFFIAGWIAGVVGTLMFGKWYTERQQLKILHDIMKDKENEDGE